MLYTHRVVTDFIVLGRRSLYLAFGRHVLCIHVYFTARFMHRKQLVVSVYKRADNSVILVLL